MKALVTGATGFIGSTLTEHLVRRGWDVLCLVRQSSDLAWIRHLGVRFLHADLLEPSSYAEAIADRAYVFHVAGLTKSSSPAAYYAANEATARTVAETALLRCRHLERFVMLSSLAAIGPSRDGTPVTEESEPAPVSDYGRSKLAGERAVLALRSRMPVTVIRPPGVYGPKDRDFYLLFKAVSRRIVPSWGSGRYSLLYAGDLAEGVINASEHPAAVGETFFLAHPDIATDDDIIRALSAAIGRRPMKIRIHRSLLPLIARLAQKVDKKGIMNLDRAQDFRYSDWTCSTRKAEHLIGFRAVTALREGMQWTADWYRTHQWL